MTDPFSELKKLLKPVFRFAAMRNDKYTYAPVQELKEAINSYRYNPDSDSSFIALREAIREALPYIEQWRVNFDGIRKSMDTLAKAHHLPPIDWRGFLVHPKVSSKFQFSALNHARQEEDLVVWLATITRKSFSEEDHTALTQAMVDNSERPGFSQKLKDYLKVHPHFLFDLAVKSKTNFIKIAETRLILYLTDEQLARIILQHLPALVHQEKGPFERVTKLMDTLNHILSNGRWIPALERNAKAKDILLRGSLFFQIYWSDDYKNRNEKEPSSHHDLDSSGLKPQI